MKNSTELLLLNILSLRLGNLCGTEQSMKWEDIGLVIVTVGWSVALVCVWLGDRQYLFAATFLCLLWHLIFVLRRQRVIAEQQASRDFDTHALLTTIHAHVVDLCDDVKKTCIYKQNRDQEEEEDYDDRS